MVSSLSMMSKARDALLRNFSLMESKISRLTQDLDNKTYKSAGSVNKFIILRNALSVNTYLFPILLPNNGMHRSADVTATSFGSVRTLADGTWTPAEFKLLLVLRIKLLSGFTM